MQIISSMKEKVKKGSQLHVMKMQQQKLKNELKKKAIELIQVSLTGLKESYDEISGGSSQTLLDITMKAINIPRV